MESSILKTEALCWLRFGKKMPYVCTEGGYWNSDALGVCDKFSVEVEVKVSIADLKREFVTKTAKHYLFANASDAVGPSKGTPNYFYFYVPPEIKDAALEIVKDKAPKAGLAVYGDGWGRPGDKTAVVHRPTRLHEAPPTAQFIKTVLNRMGSELCGRYVVQQRFLDDMLATMKAVDKGIVDVMKQMFQTPDFDQE